MDWNMNQEGHKQEERQKAMNEQVPQGYFYRNGYETGRHTTYVGCWLHREALVGSDEPWFTPPAL